MLQLQTHCASEPTPSFLLPLPPQSPSIPRPSVYLLITVLSSPIGLPDSSSLDLTQEHTLMQSQLSTKQAESPTWMTISASNASQEQPRPAWVQRSTTWQSWYVACSYGADSSTRLIAGHHCLSYFSTLKKPSSSLPITLASHLLERKPSISFSSSASEGTSAR